MTKCSYTKYALVDFRVTNINEIYLTASQKTSRANLSLALLNFRVWRCLHFELEIGKSDSPLINQAVLNLKGLSRCKPKT